MNYSVINAAHFAGLAARWGLLQGGGRLPLRAMALSSEEVLEALKGVKYPGFSRDIVSFGIIRDIQVDEGGIRIVVAPPAGDPDLVGKIRPDIEATVANLPGAGALEIVSELAPQAAQPQGGTPQQPAESHAGHSHGDQNPVTSGPRGPQPIPGVKNIIAVASGKGGVGKSTVAANLALALRKYGQVGLLDADVYGPSAPLLMGTETAQPVVTEERRITPVEAHGLRMISMGFFIEKDKPVIWRGPMVTKLVAEFIKNVEWGELDYLVLDLPPGTGDVQLTLAQQLAMNGGVIVTTPQEVALADVRRGVKMFNQVNVPVIGLVENMSGHTCTACGHETDVFGRDGGEKLASELAIPFLGRIGLVAGVGAQGDAGVPIVEAQPDSPVTQQFRQIASEISRAA